MTQFSVQGTVILNANVAFLAVGNLSPFGYSFQIASYVSTLASLGSIIIGLMLLRQNKTKDRDSATAAVRLPSHCYHSHILTKERRPSI
jgi:hypothetical protein